MSIYFNLIKKNLIKFYSIDIIFIFLINFSLFLFKSAELKFFLNNLSKLKFLKKKT